MVFTFIDEKGQEKKLGKEKPDQFIRATARAATQHFLGTYGDIANLIPGYTPGQVLPGQKARSKLEANATDQQLAGLATDADISPEYGTLPSSTQVGQLLDMLGIKRKVETPAEELGDRFGRLFGGSASFGPALGWRLIAATAGTGAFAGQAVKQMGGGPGLQTAAEILASLRLPQRTPRDLTRIRQPRIVDRNIPPAEGGFISPERMQQQLNRVNQEATQIASTIGEQNPNFNAITRSIASGHPIQQRFNQMFDGLEQVAQQFNPPVNATPLNNFLTSQAQRYANTGAPTQMSRFVIEQVHGWQQMGQPTLYNMFRRYRLNNEYIREIRQATPFNMPFTTLQRQQMGWLSEMNDAIRESFQSLHPNTPNTPAIPGQGNGPSSMWVRAFEDSNRAYTNYQNTLTARRILDPILHGDLHTNQITNFLGNQRIWEDLIRFLGPEETGHLRQLIQDMLTARTAIRAIPRREVGVDLLRHAFLQSIPGLGKLSNLLSIPRVWQWIRGRYHSGPAFQENFHELTQALVDRNGPAIERSVKALKSDKPEKKKINFIAENKK